jgi:2-iminobutanoate/2-iminopropanoate deaminase
MKAVQTPDAPAAIGPYSQAIVSGGLAYCSGQIAVSFAGAADGGHVAAETTQVLTQLDAVLRAAGSSRRQVLKTTVFLVDMADFPAMNEAYGAFFGDHAPARATVAVAGLPRGVRVEIDCIAAVDAARGADVR